jgi:hypothetical protein
MYRQVALFQATAQQTAGGKERRDNLPSCLLKPHKPVTQPPGLINALLLKCHLASSLGLEVQG